MSDAPKCATDKRFRSACREKLVELSQTSPGLAVKATLKSENAVLLFPCFGRDPRNFEELVAFDWFMVDENLKFIAMSKEDVRCFLHALRQA